MDNDSAYSEEAKTFIDGLNKENQYLVRTLRILVPELKLDALKAFSSKDLEYKLKSIFYQVRDFALESEYLKHRWNFFEKEGNKPLCYGKKGDECARCFYSQHGSEKCWWETLQKKGHSDECIGNMLWSDPCCCGVGHWLDEERIARNAAWEERQKKRYLASGHTENCAFDMVYSHAKCICGGDEAEEKRKRAFKGESLQIRKELKKIKINKDVKDDFAIQVCRVIIQANKEEDYLDVSCIQELLNQFDVAIPVLEQVEKKLTKYPKDDAAYWLIYYLLDETLGDLYDCNQCVFLDNEKYVMSRQRVEDFFGSPCLYTVELRDSTAGSNWDEPCKSGIDHHI